MMKNQMPILVDQKILNSLEDFKNEWLKLLQNRHALNKNNLMAAKNQLQQQLLILEQQLKNYQQPHYSMEFYSYLNEILQSFSPLRLEEFAWLEQMELLNLMDHFNELAAEAIYQHPFLAQKKSQEILTLPHLSSMTKTSTSQQILADLNILKNYLKKTSALAQMASERSSDFDEHSLKQWLKTAENKDKKASDTIQSLIDESTVMMLMAATAALLADRAAQVSAQFEKMLAQANSKE